MKKIRIFPFIVVNISMRSQPQTAGSERSDAIFTHKAAATPSERFATYFDISSVSSKTFQTGGVGEGGEGGGVVVWWWWGAQHYWALHRFGVQ